LLTPTPTANSAAVNNQTNEGVAIKKVTNVFSKKILAKRALREIKLLQHFRGHRNVSMAPLSILVHNRHCLPLIVEVESESDRIRAIADLAPHSVDHLSV
jgi:hypothetical protein